MIWRNLLTFGKTSLHEAIIVYIKQDKWNKVEIFYILFLFAFKSKAPVMAKFLKEARQTLSDKTFFFFFSKKVFRHRAETFIFFIFRGFVSEKDRNMC